MKNKKTIIFIHGMLVGPWCWDKYKTFFEKQGYVCVTPTLRYHSDEYVKKPHPKLGTTGLLDYVNDLEKEIKSLILSDGEKPIIVGHSMGGIIAQKLAERSLAEMVVIISSAPPAGILPFSLTGIKSIFGVRFYGGFFFWKKPIRVTLKGMKYMGLNCTLESEHKNIFDKIGYESGRVVFEIVFAFFDKSKASRVDESKVDCPMLVISASEDRVLSVSVQKKIARKYKAEYKEFEKHAHWIITEPGWEKVAKYILQWIKLR